METLAAQISSTGISAPDFPNILQQLKNGFWGIYGTDANLDADGQDGQWIAVMAQMIYDANQMAIAVYNNQSPAYAQAAALSSLVKINGIARNIATNSQAVVTAVGVAGTIITNGIVGDSLNLGTQWALPATVTIPVGGSINVTATCTQLGAITAPAGSLTRILTPTLNWQSVTNAAAAAVGAPVETDAGLRRRQAKSTALPAQTVLEALYATVGNIAGVARLSISENDTDATNADGIPEHSIAVVTKGGDVTEIATAIANKKAPGTGTYGTISALIVDANGVPVTIRYFPLTEVLITVEVTILAFPQYNSTIGDAIKLGVATFITDLDIGEDSYLARLYSPANLGGAGDGAKFVVTSIKQSRSGPVAVQDVAIAFNEAALCAVAQVTLIVT